MHADSTTNGNGRLQMNESVKDYDASAIARHVAKTCDRHRETLQRFVASKEAQNVKRGSVRNYTNWVHKWLNQVAAKPLTECTADDVVAWLNGLGRLGHKPDMVNQAAILTKAFMEWILVDHARPRSFWLAFRRRPVKQAPHEPPPTPEELARLIEAARTPVTRTLVAVLADSGFRASEALALNVESVTFDGDGTAWLRLPPNAPRLKTGAREVPVANVTPFLERLLAYHPLKGDPTAPLFYSEQRRNLHRRLKQQDATRLISRASARAGLRHFTPHDLRHYRATEAARAGWNEITMRMFFGWAKGSKMPDRYTHLTRNDLKNAVRANSAPRPPAPGVAATAAPAAGGNLNAFAEAFGRAWRAAGNSPLDG